MKQYSRWSDMILAYYFSVDMLSKNVVNKYTFNWGDNYVHNQRNIFKWVVINMKQYNMIKFSTKELHSIPFGFILRCRYTGIDPFVVGWDRHIPVYKAFLVLKNRIQP